MQEIRLTLKYGVHNLFRIGLGQDRAVYVPVQNGQGANRHCVWSNKQLEIYVAACPDHVEVTVVFIAKKPAAAAVTKAA